MPDGPSLDTTSDESIIALCREYLITLEWCAAMARKAIATGRSLPRAVAVRDDVDAMRATLALTKPHTMAGVRAKAQGWQADHPADPEDALAISVVADLLRLSGSLKSKARRKHIAAKQELVPDRPPGQALAAAAGRSMTAGNNYGTLFD